MAWSTHVALTYRGWNVNSNRDGIEKRTYYTASTTPELLARWINPSHWPSPEFESVDDAKAWIDDVAPFKLPDRSGDILYPH